MKPPAIAAAPPQEPVRSRTRTSAPERAASTAAAAPAIPNPAMTTSASSSHDVMEEAGMGVTSEPLIYRRNSLLSLPSSTFGGHIGISHAQRRGHLADPLMHPVAAHGQFRR